MSTLHPALKPNPDVLPDTRARRHVKGLVYANGMSWQPIFCANCNASGGLVPEAHTSFAFYLCNPCYEKHGVTAGLQAVPDEVYFAKVNQALAEADMQNATHLEIVKALDDESHPLAKLAKENPANKE